MPSIPGSLPGASDAFGKSVQYISATELALLPYLGCVMKFCVAGMEMVDYLAIENLIVGVTSKFVILAVEIT